MIFHNFNEFEKNIFRKTQLKQIYIKMNQIWVVLHKIWILFITFLLFYPFFCWNKSLFVFCSEEISILIIQFEATSAQIEERVSLSVMRQKSFSSIIYLIWFFSSFFYWYGEIAKMYYNFYIQFVFLSILTQISYSTHIFIIYYSCDIQTKCSTILLLHIPIPSIHPSLELNFVPHFAFCHLFSISIYSIPVLIIRVRAQNRVLFRKRCAKYMYI